MKTLPELETALIADGYRLTPDEARHLLHTAETDALCRTADRVRLHFMGNRMDTCSIMNARSGRCSEDCKWCAQSVHHRTKIDVYPLTDTAEALRHAQDNHDKGVGRFSLVTSGRAMTDREIGQCAAIYRAIAERMPGFRNGHLCASMGLLTREQLQTLKEAGVGHYHCNIETAPSYFPQLCTTHTFDEKRSTLRWAREAGMRICSGGIIGMGETAEQRIEMAFALREIGADSIPINVLNPIPGTPLEKTPPLSDDEILRTFALFRLIHPQAHIRFAGGRTLLRREVQERALRGGVNAAIVGDLLTTIGSGVAEDREMFRQCGFAE
ncbi:biotin synthase BioB [uncultured Rikenella sp.]|uniref:biotin synthase BioB n=1 Tax=uncultured Rikenella sp. TaxID=368003 RepID=UPI0026121327|nr:biotin synthase BioB [uncultured Rikenella sp.]